MAIPTAYTYATFRSYLENEILQKVAVSLSWKDKTAIPQTTYTLSGGKWDNYNLIFYPTVPTPVTFYAGTVFTGVGGTLKRSAVKGSTALIFKALGNSIGSTNTWSTQTISATLDAKEGFDAKSIYDSITNEALVLMGYSTPESVPAGAIAQFRMMGRVEAWRAVVYATVGDSDVVIADNLLNRSQVNDFSLNQVEYAEIDYNKEFPYIKPVIGKARASSYAGQLTVRF
jgi:hypothetical protein